MEGEYTHVNRAGFGACSYLLHQDRLTTTGKFANSGVISGFITVFSTSKALEASFDSLNRGTVKIVPGRGGKGEGRLEEQPRTNRKP